MKKNIGIIAILFTLIGLVTSCVDDPFVDRDVAPVLILPFGENKVLTSGLTTDPTIYSSKSKDAVLGVRVFELDKSGLLDYKIGIDSIPVSGLPITFKFRNGSSLGTASTGADGAALLTIPWSQLGGTSAVLSASGEFEGKTFTKYFRISAN